jgi:outer membrane protein insertion porin family
VDFQLCRAFLDRNLSAGFDLFHKGQLDRRSSFSQRDAAAISNSTPSPTTRRWACATMAQQDIFNVSGMPRSRSRSRRRVRRFQRWLHRRLRLTKHSVFAHGGYAPRSPGFCRHRRRRDYIRSVVDARAYRPITNKITLVSRAQAGNITGWGGEDIRLTDLFFKGGETSRL